MRRARILNYSASVEDSLKFYDSLEQVQACFHRAITSNVSSKSPCIKFLILQSNLNFDVSEITSIEEVLFTYRRSWRIILLMVITDRICSRRRLVCMEGTNISSAILRFGAIPLSPIKFLSEIRRICLSFPYSFDINEILIDKRL